MYDKLDLGKVGDYKFNCFACQERLTIEWNPGQKRASVKPHDCKWITEVKEAEGYIKDTADMFKDVPQNTRVEELLIKLNRSNDMMVKYLSQISNEQRKR